MQTLGKWLYFCFEGQSFQNIEFDTSTIKAKDYVVSQAGSLCFEDVLQAVIGYIILVRIMIRLKFMLTYLGSLC